MENENNGVVDDELELDKSLEETLNNIKAGKEPVQEPAKAEVEEKKVEGEASTPKDSEEKDEYDFRIPNKGKFESDESFEKRVELMDLVKRRKLATTPELKQALSEEIKKAKGQLKNLGGNEKVINPSENGGADKQGSEEEDESVKADKERLRQLGGLTKEDVQKVLEEQRVQTETKGTLDNFVNRHPELSDEDFRETFFEFVDENYLWQGKTGKGLMTVLELAYESMVKPRESITERVIKAAGVADKVNAMQFPGGTSNVSSMSPEMRSSIDELKATGMSEAKAIELLKDD